MGNSILTLRGQLKDAILGAFSKTEFTNVTLDNSIGYGYENINAGFEEDLGFYIDKIMRKQKTLLLIDALLKKAPEDEKLKAVKKAFHEMYIPVGENLEYNENIFYRQLVNNRSILFIGREEFCRMVSRMVNKKSIRMLGLKGLPQSGHSYVTKYFGDLAEELKCFNYINLNLRTITEENELTGTVQASDLAAIISEHLGMESLPNFKYQSFFIGLRKKLEELEKKGECWLFFIDQFSYPHHENVEIFLKKLGKELIDYPNKFYLVFSIYKEWSKQWEVQDQTVTETVEFPHFSKIEIDDYLQKLYLSETLKVVRNEVSQQEFIDYAHTHLKPEYFQMTEDSNVPLISVNLKIWYRALKNTYQL